MLAEGRAEALQPTLPGRALLPPACARLRALAHSRAPSQAAPGAENAFADLKHADHRRLLSRWGKALFRFAGVRREDFARRTGSYRENFLHVLTGAPAAGSWQLCGVDHSRVSDFSPARLSAPVCFGSCFEGPGNYWYDHSNAGAFASALLYCATSGRVTVDEAHTYALFTKKDPERTASSWIVDEQQLAAWGVAPAELAALFRGPQRSEAGFPRGVPLLVPPPHLLPPPAPGGAAVGAAATAAGAATIAALSGAAPLLGWPSLPVAAAAALQQAASMAPPPAHAPELPFSDGPLQLGSLQRQNTVATLAILMCQSEHLERAAASAQGRQLDRTFSDGARAFMAAIAGGGRDSLPAPSAPGQELHLGSAAPAWAQRLA